MPIISEIGNFMLNKKVDMVGLKTGESIERAYDNMAMRKGVKKIKDIRNIPLVIPSVDVKMAKEFIFTNRIPEKCQEKAQYITDISVGKAVRASSSFPGVFCPCNYEEHKFLDGGILDNVPVWEVKKQGADKVIAINFKADDIDEESNMVDIAMRTIDIMGNKISEESLEKCDYVLTIQTDKTGLLEIEKLDKCYQYGYQAAKQQIDKIRNIFII